MQKQYEIFRNACQGDALRITTVETLGQVSKLFTHWRGSNQAIISRGIVNQVNRAGRNKGKLIAAREWKQSAPQLCSGPCFPLLSQRHDIWQVFARYTSWRLQMVIRTHQIG